MRSRHVAYVISIPLLIVGYGRLYTSDLFLSTDRYPVLTVSVVLVLAGLWAVVFLLHGLLVPWAEGRGAPSAMVAEPAAGPAAPAAEPKPEPVMPPVPTHPRVWWAARAEGDGVVPPATAALDGVG